MSSRSEDSSTQDVEIGENILVILFDYSRMHCFKLLLDTDPKVDENWAIIHSSESSANSKDIQNARYPALHI